MEDTAEAHDRRRRGEHACNAMLKCVSGKGQAELEAAVTWLGRTRLSDNLGVIEGDRPAGVARRGEE